MTRNQIAYMATLLASVDAIAISQLADWPIAQCILGALMPITWVIGLAAGMDAEEGDNQ